MVIMKSVVMIYLLQQLLPAWMNGKTGGPPTTPYTQIKTSITGEYRIVKVSQQEKKAIE